MERRLGVGLGRYADPARLWRLCALSASAAQAVPVDGGNDRLGHLSNELHDFSTERHALLEHGSVVSGLHFHHARDVAARAEGVARPSNDDAAYDGLLRGLRQSCQEILAHHAAQGVHDVRTIQRNCCAMIGNVEKNVRSIHVLKSNECKANAQR